MRASSHHALLATILTVPVVAAGCAATDRTPAEPTADRTHAAEPRAPVLWQHDTGG